MKYRTRTHCTDTQKALMWERWKEGWTLHQIAQLFNRAHTSVQGILSRTGGIRPPTRSRRATTLTLAEREEISRAMVDGQSIRSVAARLGRAPSTVSREIKRNGGQSDYRAGEADSAAWDRALRPKDCKLVENKALARIVSDKLRMLWSPEQIAGWLKHTCRLFDLPDPEQSLKVQPGGQQCGDQIEGQGNPRGQALSLATGRFRVGSLPVSVRQPSRLEKKLSISRATSSGRVIAGRWPEPSITTNWLSGISECRYCITSVRQNASSWPWISSVGSVSRGNLSAQSIGSIACIVKMRSATSGVDRDRILTAQRRMCSLSGSGTHLSANHPSRAPKVAPGQFDGAGRGAETSPGRVTSPEPFISSSPSKRSGLRSKPATP
jgi:DNA-binding CsgD family transcriptional regulator